MNHKFCLKRDKPERKREIGEHVFTVSRAPLPALIDLRPSCPPVYDQGPLGSCTANAIGAAYQFDQLKQHNKFVCVPSRLFIYYNERKMEGTVSEDCGASISDGVISTHTTGIVQEDHWPYDVSKFAVAPPAALYEEAKHHITGNFKSITQSLTQLKTCLSEGYPIILGIILYSSFQSDVVTKTGVVPMPKPKEDCLGGHAVCCVGYDDVKKRFIMRNSWGPAWGDKGYFYLPYEYLTDPNLACDFWAILNVVDRSINNQSSL